MVCKLRIWNKRLRTMIFSQRDIVFHIFLTLDNAFDVISFCQVNKLINKTAKIYICQLIDKFFPDSHYTKTPWRQFIALTYNVCSFYHYDYRVRHYDYVVRHIKFGKRIVIQKHIFSKICTSSDLNHRNRVSYGVSEYWDTIYIPGLPLSREKVYIMIRDNTFISSKTRSGVVTQFLKSDEFKRLGLCIKNYMHGNMLVGIYADNQYPEIGEKHSCKSNWYGKLWWDPMKVESVCHPFDESKYQHYYDHCMENDLIYRIFET